MKDNPQRVFESVIAEILDERFVHSLSELTYNSVSSIWHLSEDSEKELAKIASKVVCGIFCLKYLSHIDGLIKKKLRIKGLTDRDLSDPEKRAGIIESIKSDGEFKALVEEVLPRLRELVESVEAGDLEKLTQLAHTGDYLLGALDDLKASGHADYRLWISSVPHYYEKDLEYMGVRGGPVLVRDLERFAGSTWKGQIPIEVLSLNMRPSARRINLHQLLSRHSKTLRSGPERRSARRATKRKG